jgi:hypothetical protein
MICRDNAQQIAINAGEDDWIIVGKILERDTCEGVELLILDNLSSLTAGCARTIPTPGRRSGNGCGAASPC